MGVYFLLSPRKAASNCPARVEFSRLEGGGTDAVVLAQLQNSGPAGVGKTEHVAHCSTASASANVAGTPACVCMHSDQSVHCFGGGCFGCTYKHSILQDTAGKRPRES